MKKSGVVKNEVRVVSKGMTLCDLCRLLDVMNYFIYPNLGNIKHNEMRKPNRSRVE